MGIASKPVFQLACVRSALTTLSSALALALVQFANWGPILQSTLLALVFLGPLMTAVTAYRDFQRTSARAIPLIAVFCSAVPSVLFVFMLSMVF